MKVIRRVNCRLWAVLTLAILASCATPQSGERKYVGLQLGKEVFLYTLVRSSNDASNERIGFVKVQPQLLTETEHGRTFALPAGAEFLLDGIECVYRSGSLYVGDLEIDTSSRAIVVDEEGIIYSVNVFWLREGGLKTILSGDSFSGNYVGRIPSAVGETKSAM